MIQMNNSVPQIKFNNQLILTTEQLAEFYGTTTNVIKKNFSNNHDKFIEGKHYFLLEGDHLKAFKKQVKNLHLVGKRSSHLHLWTKRGASRHAKMLGTDRAWDVYDELEENYFNPQTQAFLPQTPEEKITLLLQNANEDNKRIKQIDNRVTDLEDNQNLAPGEYNYISHRVRAAVNEYEATHHLLLTQKQRSKLYKDINTGLNQVTGIKTRTQLRKKDFDTADEYIRNWQPSTATLQIIKQLSGIAEGQMSLKN